MSSGIRTSCPIYGQPVRYSDSLHQVTSGRYHPDGTDLDSEHAFSPEWQPGLRTRDNLAKPPILVASAPSQRPRWRPRNRALGGERPILLVNPAVGTGFGLLRVMTTVHHHARRDRLLGFLLGLALGDALGLPYEGMSAKRVARRSQRLDRFRLLGATGFVSDDTEQSALVAQALCREPRERERCVRAFRRSLLGWFARLPFGIGGATLRACVRIALGFRRTGVRSAGNGAAMRAGVLGAWFADAPERRRDYGRALAQITHTDERAIEGALYVAELSAGAACAEPEADRYVLVRNARAVLVSPQLQDALDRAQELARAGATPAAAVAALGNTGFIVHTVGIASFCFLRAGASPLDAIQSAIRAGGDTDTHAAIVGGWVGALHGASALPTPLIQAIHDGPFGPTHLRGLADALFEDAPPPRWSRARALLRNLALYPVILGHGFARLIPR